LPAALYLAIIMDRYRGPHTPLTIAFHSPYYSLSWRDLLTNYNGIYGGPKSELTIALPVGFYLAFIMDRYRRPQISFTIALPGVLYLAIIM
jgi:hypothetical protein